MAAALQIVMVVLLAIGSLFYVIGAVGLIRMPDVYTRLHASSVMDSLGAISLLVAMMFAAGWSLETAKLAIILGILLYTGPVATHALARAALTADVKPELAEDRTAQPKETSATKEIPEPDAKARRAGPESGKGGES